MRDVPKKLRLIAVCQMASGAKCYMIPFLFFFSNKNRYRDISSCLCNVMHQSWVNMAYSHIRIVPISSGGATVEVAQQNRKRTASVEGEPDLCVHSVKIIQRGKPGRKMLTLLLLLLPHRHGLRYTLVLYVCMACVCVCGWCWRMTRFCST